MELGVRLTVVGSELEAEMICSLLRSHGIQATERSAGPLGPTYASPGGWYEVLVAAADVAGAEKVLATRS